eukprot:ctg_3022.g693
MRAPTVFPRLQVGSPVYHGNVMEPPGDQVPAVGVREQRVGVLQAQPAGTVAVGLSGGSVPVRGGGVFRGALAAASRRSEMANAPCRPPAATAHHRRPSRAAGAAERAVRGRTSVDPTTVLLHSLRHVQGGRQRATARTDLVPDERAGHRRATGGAVAVPGGQSRGRIASAVELAAAGGRGHHGSDLPDLLGSLRREFCTAHPRGPVTAGTHRTAGRDRFSVVARHLLLDESVVSPGARSTAATAGCAADESPAARRRLRQRPADIAATAPQPHCTFVARGALGRVLVGRRPETRRGRVGVRRSVVAAAGGGERRTHRTGRLPAGRIFVRWRHFPLHHIEHVGIATGQLHRPETVHLRHRSAERRAVPQSAAPQPPGATSVHPGPHHDAGLRGHAGRAGGDLPDDPDERLMVRRLQRLRESLLHCTDRRVQLMSETLGAIKVIKVSAWENEFRKRMAGVRTAELEHARAYMYFNFGNLFLFSVNPVLASVACFTTYAVMGNALSVSRAFAALALFNNTRVPLNYLPIAIGDWLQARVATRRLEEFLNQPELRGRAQFATRHAVGVQFEACDFAWADAEVHGRGGDAGDRRAISDAERTPLLAASRHAHDGDGLAGPMSATDTFMLRDITLQVGAGALIAVIGPVGAGKSSLLSAVLGEMHLLRGAAHLRGSIAYCAQAAFIVNASVRDNVLFGRPYHAALYRRAVRAACLVADLKTLPAGDHTMIGMKGVTLSGGQKQRISVARAVYADADLYVLDDVLSAVDAHVASTMWDECITGALRRKARLISMNQINLLPGVDYIVFVDGGRILWRGTPDQFAESKLELARFLLSDGISDDEAASEALGSLLSSSHAEESLHEDEDSHDLHADAHGSAAQQDEEETDTGHIPFSVLRSYIAAYGSACFIFGIVAGFALDRQTATATRPAVLPQHLLWVGAGQLVGGVRPQPGGGGGRTSFGARPTPETVQCGAAGATAFLRRHAGRSRAESLQQRPGGDRYLPALLVQRVRQEHVPAAGCVHVDRHQHAGDGAVDAPAGGSVLSGTAVLSGHVSGTDSHRGHRALTGVQPHRRDAGRGGDGARLRRRGALRCAAASAAGSAFPGAVRPGHRRKVVGGAVELFGNLPGDAGGGVLGVRCAAHGCGAGGLVVGVRAKRDRYSDVERAPVCRRGGPVDLCAAPVAVYRTGGGGAAGGAALSPALRMATARRHRATGSGGAISPRLAARAARRVLRDPAQGEGGHCGTHRRRQEHPLHGAAAPDRAQRRAHPHRRPRCRRHGPARSALPSGDHPAGPGAVPRQCAQQLGSVRGAHRCRAVDGVATRAAGRDGAADRRAGGVGGRPRRQLFGWSTPTVVRGASALAPDLHPADG